MTNRIQYSFTVIVALHKMQEELQDFIDWVNEYNHNLNKIFFILKDSGFNKKHLESLNYQENLKIIIREDNSIYEAWNQAIVYVPTKYVMFLGITDRLKTIPNELFKSFDDEDLIYFDFLKKDVKNTKTKTVNKNSLVRKFPINISFCFSSSLIKKEFLTKNKFCSNFEYKIIGDVDWLISNLNIIKSTYVDIQPFVIFETMGISNSPYFFKQRMKEYRMITKINKYSILHFIFYYIASLIKIILKSDVWNIWFFF